MTRHAIAVIFSVEADDGDAAYEAITGALDEALHDNLADVATEFATGAFDCPADHDPDSTDWDIRGLYWHGQPVKRSDALEGFCAHGIHESGRCGQPDCAGPEYTTR